jgi:hypothetical protein
MGDCRDANGDGSLHVYDHGDERPQRVSVFREVTYTINIAAAVPTVPEWAMIALVGLLGVAGVAATRRRMT